MRIIPQSCKVDGCYLKGRVANNREYFPSGYCWTHYQRMHKNGVLTRKTRVLRARANHPLTNTWHGMMRRCYDTEHKSYKYYGGRGITVCDRWHNFDYFEEDLIAPPLGMTLDRIEVNGDYEPSNCRWATIIEQANNTRKNNVLTIDGDSKTVTQWSQYSKVSPSQIARRVRAGWSHKDAVFGDRLRA